MRQSIEYLDKLIKPIARLWDRADFALPFMLINTLIVESFVRPLYERFLFPFMSSVGGAIIELTLVDIKLVVGLVAVIIFDTVTGIRYSKRVKQQKFSSFRFRDLNYKIIEYGTFCIVMVIFSNMAGGQDWIKTLTFTYLAGVEVSSIVEKSENANVSNLFTKIKSKLSDIFGGDDSKPAK